jgi:UDP-3-O-[3-hydroxymyristoyl] N-acetylglucosamine deacetylase
VRFPANGSAARHEHTIERPVTASGVGLHCGAAANLRLAPAPAGQGVVFVRTDLDNFSIRASWRHVAKVSYATSLMRQSVLLSTTEHLLSSLRALGIDNVRVEIDHLEVPILDGSALPWAELLHEAGIRKQRRHRRYLRILQPVEVREGDKRISIEPAAEFEVVCETRYPHPLVGPQRLEMAITPQAYLAGIAPARTFGFEQDLAMLRDMGLIRGASLENAVCFGPDSVLNQGGLRFPDEPCRHKLLDLIGDLALLGYPLLGRVVASRAGHAMHVALVDRIMHDPSSYELVTLDQLERAGGASGA